MEKNKIEIVFQPIKKIVIFECTEFSEKEFFERIELLLRSGHPLILNWAEGVLFLPMALQTDSDVIMQETLKGTMYLASILFTSMPKYSPMKRIRTLEIPIVNQTSIPHFVQVAQWLKNRSKK